MMRMPPQTQLQGSPLRPGTANRWSLPPPNELDSHSHASLTGPGAQHLLSSHTHATNQTSKSYERSRGFVSKHEKEEALPRGGQHALESSTHSLFHHWGASAGPAGSRWSGYPDACIKTLPPVLFRSSSPALQCWLAEELHEGADAPNRVPDILSVNLKVILTEYGLGW